MFDIQLVSSDNKKKTLIVSHQTSVEFLKKKSGIDENVELIFNGEILEDGMRLSDYGIKEESHIYVINVNTKTIIEDSQTQQNLMINNLLNILNQYNASVQSSEINRYQNELDILESMGFTDRAQNQTLLTIYNGNVEVVTGILLGEM